jgi:PEP-CTERM motif
MPKWPIGLLTLAVSLSGGLTAEAAPIPITSVTPAELLADFNVIVKQDDNSNDINGPVLVGGDLGPGTGPLNSTGVVLGTTPGTTAIIGYGEVDIFGSHTASNNNTNGSVFVGGASSGTFDGASSVTFNYAFPPGASVSNNPATFNTYIWAPLTTLSSNLAGLTPNSTLTGTTFTGVAGPNGAVFSVPLSTLSALTGTLSFAGCLALATPCDAVIDVTGAGTLDNAALAFPLVAAGFPNIIVNFDDDVTVDVGNVWTASILDPLGSVSATTDITGNVVAENFTNTAETHLPGFDCSDDLCGTPNTPVPEPGSLALLGAGLGSLALLLRSRRRHS